MASEYRTACAADIAEIIADAERNAPLGLLRARIREAGPRPVDRGRFRIWTEEGRKALQKETERRQARNEGIVELFDNDK